MINTFQIFSGSTVSSPVPVRGASDAFLFCPILSSGQVLALQASFDPTSANFVPVFDPRSAGGAVSLVVNSGPVGINIWEMVRGAGFIRLVTTPAQIADRTFLLETRNR